MTEIEQKEYKEYLKTLAPLGVIKEALELYQTQTHEFLKNGCLSVVTFTKIAYFDLFCIENDYKTLFILAIASTKKSHKNEVRNDRN